MMLANDPYEALTSNKKCEIWCCLSVLFVSRFHHLVTYPCKCCFVILDAQPSVDAAMISPKAVVSEPRKSTIGVRKPAAKKGVSKTRVAL